MLCNLEVQGKIMRGQANGQCFFVDISTEPTVRKYLKLRKHHVTPLDFATCEVPVLVYYYLYHTPLEIWYWCTKEPVLNMLLLMLLFYLFCTRKEELVLKKLKKM
mmetsp:Transcript_36010/g.46265  ORF Transcript_36010/g.46265 Transcript_36010/m.46265 type:complete len:105 (-) Transcript_36010:155-469(-)